MTTTRLKSLCTAVGLLLLWTSFMPQATAAAAQERRQRREARAGEGARLELECTEYDFGTVERRGGDLKVTIRFRNAGTSPLVLTRIITSCSCLKAQFSKRPVAVGETGEIHFTYEPLKAAPGTFHKVVQVLSNSASGRELITLRGNSQDKKKQP